MVTVQSVKRDSAAGAAGVKQGDRIISINRKPVTDVLDFPFLIAEAASGDGISEAWVSVRSTVTISGEKKTCLKIFYLIWDEEQDDDCGITIENLLEDGKKGCRNNCVFCFINQLPQGLRKALYFKDDDERLSFLHGNYITLTNLSDAEVERVCRYRLPLNVSVHTTEPALRSQMMRNPRAGDALSYLWRILGAGCTVNAQVVLCPDYNDGYHLERTLEDLLKYDNVNSVAVVPVGLTKYHKDGLRQFSPEEAEYVINQIYEINVKYPCSDGNYMRVQPADEFYLSCDMDVPDASVYGDFPQYENGVGMIAYEREIARAALAGIKPTLYDEPQKRYTIATGEASFPLMCELSELTMAKLPVEIDVIAVKNHFFGGNVTVTGLLTGEDLLARLLQRQTPVTGSMNISAAGFGECVFISAGMLNADGLFLDGITPKQVETALGIKLVPTEDFAELIEKIKI